MAEDRTGVVARLDALEAAHKGATVIGLLKDDEHRARLDARWTVLQRVPDLLAAVRGVLDLADELDLRADAKGSHPMPGYDEGYRAGLSDGEGYAADRLRAVVAAALGEA